MSRRTWIVVGVLVAAIAGVAALWSQVLLPSDADPREVAEGEDPAEPWPEDDEWMLDERAETPRRRERAEGQPGPGWQGEWGRRPEPGTPEFEAWQERRRERFRQMVDIAPLGERAPGIDAEAVRAALEPGREAMRQCIQEAGGFDRMRRGMRGTLREAGRRRRTATFDVRPDGTVDQGSIAMDPPPPERFEACFRTFVASARFENPGDGARVEIPMGPRRGRRRNNADGGVPDRRR